jgi:penicillin-binding protein 2
LVTTPTSHDQFVKRTRIVTLIMLIFLGTLTVGLWRLQLTQRDAFEEKSRTNRVRLVRLPPSRGKILDANGHVLAENKPSFTFSVLNGELENAQEVIQTCAPILGIPQERMRSLIERSKAIPKFMGYPVKKNVTLEEVSLVQARSADLRGVILETKPYRVYPFGQSLCHVVGTLGEISAEELEKGATTGYRPGDQIGKTGVEKEYENYLRGEEGWEQIEIDAKGRQLSELDRNPARTGSDITLTVDVALQRYVEDIFVERAGSVVAVDPDSGRILAMLSRPGFDLNMFSPSVSEREWKNLNSDPLHPLENRSIRGLYSPASTFKIVTAAAGLAERTVKIDRKFTCNGEIDLGGVIFRCWNPYGHGKVDLRRAIVESCDIYFYELGLRTGADRIARWASLFGFGKPCGLELPQELPGLVPTSAWKMRTYGEPMKDGETVTIAIGQGYVSSTPLQLAMMTAALANGGKLMRPAIVKQIRSSDGNIIYEHSPVLRWNIPLDPKDFEFLRSAMREVVADKRGTGKRCLIPGITVRAKTGTSQVISTRKNESEGDQVPYHERTHAMFIAYVDDRPQKIALVVIVEHGGGGGIAAAPLARKLISRYYGLKDAEEPTE